MACGTAQAPREAAPLGGREAMVAGGRTTPGRSPTTRCVSGGEIIKNMPNKSGFIKNMSVKVISHREETNVLIIPLRLHSRLVEETRG